MLQFTLIVIFINPINIIGNTNGALQPETQKNFRAYSNRPATNSSSAFEHRIDVPEENASLLEKISNNQLLSNPSKPTHTFDHRIDIPDNLSFIQQHGNTNEFIDYANDQPSADHKENQYSTSNCSVYEHIIDIPETATFLEQFESSPYEIKVNISYEKAIEFLKMITDFSLIINLPNFHRMNIKLQLYVISTQIVLKLRENHQNVGQNLIGIVNKYSNYCRHIGEILLCEMNIGELLHWRNEQQHFDTLIFNLQKMDMGKKLCFVGMFVSMSEFINKKMTENIEQFTKRHKNWVSANPKLRQRLGLYDVNKHAVPKQFLERQNTSQMADLYTNMIFYSLSIDQMFNFWIKTKSIMTAANKTNDDKDQKHRILSQEIKKKLDDLTRETLFDFISSKIELEA